RRHKRFSIKIPFAHRHPLPRSHPVLPVKLTKRIQHASHHIEPRVIDKRLKSVPRDLVKRVSTELIDETIYFLAYFHVMQTGHRVRSYRGCRASIPLWRRSEEHMSELQSRFDLVC